MKSKTLVISLVLSAFSFAAHAQLGASLPDGGVPMGTGAGYHSPNSPFAPLQERADVLPWSVLTATRTRIDKNKVLPVFPGTVQALDQKSQRIQGFMMPLEPGDK